MTQPKAGNGAIGTAGIYDASFVIRVDGIDLPRTAKVKLTEQMLSAARLSTKACIGNDAEGKPYRGAHLRVTHEVGGQKVNLEALLLAIAASGAVKPLGASEPEKRAFALRAMVTALEMAGAIKFRPAKGGGIVYLADDAPKGGGRVSVDDGIKALKALLGS